MTSKALVVAKRDFAAAARSRLLWGVVLVLLVVTIPDFLNVVGGDLIDSVEQATRFIPVVFQYFVAPIAMITGYRSVVGERESGTLRVLFGHPVTRRDLVVGKLVSRSALLATILLFVTACLGVVAATSYGTLAAPLLVAIAGYVALYGVVWSGITVGISAAVSSRLQAITGVLALFLFFGPFQLWDRLAVPAFALAFTGSASTAGIDALRPSTWPTWYRYVLRLNPMENFDQGRFYVASVVDPSIAASARPVDLFGLAVFVAWFAVPLAVGYWRFERADLT